MTIGNLRMAIIERTPELVGLRRQFHAHPELAWEEHETAGTIAAHLRRAGLEVTEGVGSTGVVGLLHGTAHGLGSGKTLLVRADMDALPIHEATSVAYRSRVPGKMHACGHDAHLAIALTLVQVLSSLRDRFHGTVKFAFQPAEEGVGGAERMIADGAMENPHVEAVIGLHVWSLIPAGEVAVQAGPFFASADEITVLVRGRGGHGAMPHLNVDPIVAAAQIVMGVQTLVSREISPLHSAVVTFGTIHGGTACNVVADEVELRGTVRAYDPRDRELLLRRIREVSSGIAESLGARVEIQEITDCPACVNDPAITQLVRHAATATVGSKHIAVGDQRQSVSDDMAFFLAHAPGCYFLVGAGNAMQRITAPHHSNTFAIDEACLPIGVEILARTVLGYLHPPSQALSPAACPVEGSTRERVADGAHRRKA